MKQKRVVLKTMPRKGKIIGTISALLVLITYILPIIEVRVLDTLINGFGKESARFFLLMVVMLSLIYGFYYVYEPLIRYLQNRMRMQVRQSMQASFAEKLAYLSMETLEKPEHQTLLNRLKEGGEQCVVSAFFAVLSMVGSAVSIAGIFSFVAHADLRYVFFLAGMLAAMLAVCVYVGKSRVAFSRIRQESSRRSEYLRGILFEKRLAQEKKLFGYTEYIHSLYKDEDDRSVKSMRKGMFRVESVVWIYENITYLFAASSYFLLLFPLFEKKISIGLYVALMPALTKIGNFAVRTVKEYVPALWQYHAYAEDLKQLQTMEEQQAVPAGKRQIKQFQTIEFQDVTFFYPNKKEAVLNQFCLKIEQGKSYAVVGENGCGKTTMVKLLLGLYQPFEGAIKIDGVDISQLAAAGEAVLSVVVDECSHKKRNQHSWSGQFHSREVSFRLPEV